MTSATPPPQRLSASGQVVDRLAQLPWWALLILLAGVLLTFQILTNEVYASILTRLAQGIGMTIFATLSAYVLAILIGLVAGLGRVSKNPVLYNLSTAYVQVIRGVPILVQLLYFAFVVVPAGAAFLGWIGQVLVPVLGPDNFLAQITPQSMRQEVRVIVSLAIAYGGFEAETFRAGIESIGRGQMEAARSLGMTYPQAMRYVILPQAIRRILPPLGNDLISMLKDSSLFSVLGLNDITNQARLYVAASFRYLETYTVLAFLYLSLTLVLSLFTKWLETRLGKFGS